jgi:hypothetical protein
MRTDRGTEAVLAAGVQQRMVRPADLVAVVARTPRLRHRAIIVNTLNDISGGSEAHHMDAVQWWADMDRENGIKLDGYLVLRFTAFVVRYRPDYVASQIRDAFRRSGRALTA